MERDYSRVRSPDELVFNDGMFVYSELDKRKKTISGKKGD